MGRIKAPAGCGGCVHVSYEGGCDYLLHTGHSRGCSPGEGCLVKETGDKHFTPRPTLPPRADPPGGIWENGAPRTYGRGHRAWKVAELSQNQTVCRMYAEGASDRLIARAAGCCVTTVSKWRRETGRPANYDRGRKTPRETRGASKRKKGTNGNQGNDPAGRAR